MVGYNPNDPMTPSEKVAAGVCSGMITKFITQPLDMIKIRSQLQRKTVNRLSTYSVASKIVSEEGITAFYHGHVLGQIISIVLVTSQFFTYELTTQLAEMTVPNDYKNLTHFICGIASGCVSTTLGLPLEVIRIRQMLVKEQYKGLLSGARKVYRYGGIRAFFQGLNASLLQMGPQAGAQFTIFNLLQPLILQTAFSPCLPEECKSGNMYRATDLAVASSVAASCAGFTGKTISYPLDLVKRRLQIATHKTCKKYKTPSQSRDLLRCTSIINCLIQAYQSEGIRGLYRGWAVTIFKTQITSITAFTAYELICYTIREVKHKKQVENNPDTKG